MNDKTLNDSDENRQKREWVRATADWQQERFHDVATRRERMQRNGRCKRPSSDKRLCDLRCGECEYYCQPQCENDVAPMRHISEVLAEVMADLAGKCEAWVLCIRDSLTVDKLSRKERFLAFRSVTSCRRKYALCTGKTLHSASKHSATFHLPNYSHSIVAGGLLVMS